MLQRDHLGHELQQRCRPAWIFKSSGYGYLREHISTKHGQ